ncbi:MAG TPA: L-threonylcarbamoyladenylate synthase [Streptosporangiaceae bacterium]|jgi:tRNA threonylcarbamoyl adenosine modification protein (Sua5/YciO/YrdC/YwlC family)|nr:L-threonylcarbamoyladenylate synthase [Streptosporangiaceae bacterium]
MTARFDCADPVQRTAGLEAAITALRNGELAVLPTDTVYGLAADAFSPVAVAMLFSARGRNRSIPPTVLVGTARAAAALAADLGAFGQDLIDEFWPGALTLVFRASPTLLWDLGDTKGTVALRMPLHSVALEVLKQTGPLAVSSANRHGHPAAITADEAQQQLGESVSVYLDNGPCAENIPSTILDLTGTIPKVLRAGAISVDRLRMVASVIADNEHYTDGASPTADSATAASPAFDGPVFDSPAFGSSAADFKPAAPHPLEGSGGPAGPAAGEPPSGA